MPYSLKSLYLADPTSLMERGAVAFDSQPPDLDQSTNQKHDRFGDIFAECTVGVARPARIDLSKLDADYEPCDAPR